MRERTGDNTGSHPLGPANPFSSMDISWISGVAFVHEDFVGSKREMSANRPH
jgi:hypothetical protein